jgi:hypothetical protein
MTSIYETTSSLIYGGERKSGFGILVLSILLSIVFTGGFLSLHSRFCDMSNTKPVGEKFNPLPTKYNKPYSTRQSLPIDLRHSESPECDVERINKTFAYNKFEKTYNKKYNLKSV